LGELRLFGGIDVIRAYSWIFDGIRGQRPPRLYPTDGAYGGLWSPKGRPTAAYGGPKGGLRPPMTAAYGGLRPPMTAVGRPKGGLRPL